MKIQMLFKLISLHWFLKTMFIISLIFLGWLFIAVILPLILPAKIIKDSEVSGVIIQSEIWQGEIRVVGDLVTAPSTKITVMPGTKVFISKTGDKFNLDFNIEHQKIGINTGKDLVDVRHGEPFWDEKEKVQLHFYNLEVEGNARSRVVFSSGSGDGSPYDINLIEVKNGQINYADFSNYRRLEIGRQVKITNSSFENTGECAICVSKGKPSIVQNTFKVNQRSYIDVGDGAPDISKNQFWDSLGDGIVYNGGISAVVKVSDNFFQMPAKNTIKILSFDEGGFISGNFFSSGNITLSCGSKIRLEQNVIKIKVIFSNTSDCSGEYVIGANYWEINDPKSVLDSRIVGKSGQFKVVIPVVLQMAPNTFYK